MNPSYRSFILAVSVFFVLSASTSAAPGDLDATLGNAGRIYPPSSSQSQYSEGIDVVVQPDQKILVSESYYHDGKSGLSLSRYLPNGTLDPTFGVGGRVLNGEIAGGGLALQPDRRILVIAGNQILRYETDGSLDTTFDADGVLPFGARAQFTATTLAVQNDGKIVVGGARYTQSGDPSLFWLARLNSDGAFDSAFGSNGIVSTEFPYPTSYIGNIVIQADGKIVAAGATFTFSSGSYNNAIALSRYQLDGSLDTSFGTSGRVAMAFKNVWGSNVTLQADNKIVVAAHYGDGGVVIRFMPDGSLDAAFGDAGQVSIPNLCPRDIAVQLDGKIVVAGGTTDYSPSNSSHELGRLLTNGMVDPTFGTNGRVTTVFPNLPQGCCYINGSVWGMAIQRDGKILTVGYWSGTDGDGNWNWNYSTIARYIGDTPTCANPIDCADFFVRQQYLDFLGREPEPQGFNDWMNVLNNCNGDSTCLYGPNGKRVLVSESFLGSQEFTLKGGYVFRFYKASLARIPTYAEMVAGMTSLNGATPDEVNAKRVTFANDWVARSDFLLAFPRSLTATEFVDNISQTAGITLSNRTQIISDLSANNTDAGRAIALRAIVDSQEEQNHEFNPAFVFMQYVGYLRRDPDPNGYQDWLTYLNTHPGDFNTMVWGFVDSAEYRHRFGP